MLNVNNNCPQFDKAARTVTYTGSSNIGSIVAIVSATDKDQSSLNYTIISGNSDGYFTVENGGVVTTKKQFLWSFTKNFNLRINVFDGICSDQTTLNVKVSSCANPEDYQFEKSHYTFNLYENHTLGFISTIKVKGTKADHYSISTNAYFTVASSTGEHKY